MLPLSPRTWTVERHVLSSQNYGNYDIGVNSASVLKVE